MATAAIAGLSIAALYAILGNLYFAMPAAGFLRWSLLPGLGIIIAALTTAIFAATNPITPGTWHRAFAYPNSSIVTAALGMGLLEYSITTGVNTNTETLFTIIGRVGGILIAIGAAIALVETNLWRILVSMPLAVFAAAIAGFTSTGLLAAIYVIAANIWWLKHAANVHIRTIARRQTIPTQPATRPIDLVPGKNAEATGATIEPDAH